MRRQRLLTTAAALAGAALFVYAVRRAGVADIVQAVQRVGWGLVLILAIAGLRFVIRAECWRWSSLTPSPHVRLTESPCPRPDNWLDLLNEPS